MHTLRAGCGDLDDGALIDDLDQAYLADDLDDLGAHWMTFWLILPWANGSVLPPARVIMIR